MSVTGPDIFKLIGYIQDDLRGAQAKLTTVRAMLASVKLPEDERRASEIALRALAGNLAADYPDDALVEEAKKIGATNAQIADVLERAEKRRTCKHPTVVPDEAGAHVKCVECGAYLARPLPLAPVSEGDEEGGRST